MADSILTSVKKALGIDEDYEDFDPDILMHINSNLATLNQIGIGPENGLEIEDKTVMWDALLAGDARLNNVKTWLYSKVRLVFDPPTTSFAIEAINNVIRELEYRFYTYSEVEKQR